MYRFAVILALAAACFAPTAFAQGMNNNYPIDSTDVQNALSMLGLEVYKFPVRAPADSSVFLNYIVEVYEDGELVKTINQRESWKKTPKEYVRMFAEAAQLSDSNRFLRVYWHTRAPGDVAVRLAYESGATNYTFEFDAEKFGLAQCRAMNWTTSQITEKKPVSVYYSAYKDKEAISCPGSAPVEAIVQRYGHVIVVYVEASSMPE